MNRQTGKSALREKKPADPVTHYKRRGTRKGSFEEGESTDRAGEKDEAQIIHSHLSLSRATSLHSVALRAMVHEKEIKPMKI